MGESPMKSFGFLARAACFDPLPEGPIFGVLPPKPDPPRDQERKEKRERPSYESVTPDYWVKDRSERMRAGWLAAAEKRRQQRKHMVDSFLRKRGDANETKDQNPGG